MIRVKRFWFICGGIVPFRYWWVFRLKWVGVWADWHGGWLRVPFCLWTGGRFVKFLWGVVLFWSRLTWDWRVLYFCLQFISWARPWSPCTSRWWFSVTWFCWCGRWLPWWSLRWIRWIGRVGSAVLRVRLGVSRCGTGVGWLKGTGFMRETWLTRVRLWVGWFAFWTPAVFGW